MDNLLYRSRLEALRTRAVMFDLDDTLVDRRSAITPFASLFVNTYFPTRSPEQRGLMAEKFLEIDQCNNFDHEGLFKRFYRYFEIAEMPELHSLIDFWNRNFAQFSHAFDCTADLLTMLRRKGRRVVLLTNGRVVLQNSKIDAENLRGYFDCIVISGEYGIHKPDKEIFDIALEKSGLEPEDCIYIGDNPVNDILGCHRAGMRGVWINPDGQEWSGEGEPYAQVSSLQEFMAAVEKWENI